MFVPPGIRIKRETVALANESTIYLLLPPFLLWMYDVLRMHFPILARNKFFLLFSGILQNLFSTDRGNPDAQYQLML